MDNYLKAAENINKSSDEILNSFNHAHKQLEMKYSSEFDIYSILNERIFELESESEFSPIEKTKIITYMSMFYNCALRIIKKIDDNISNKENDELLVSYDTYIPDKIDFMTVRLTFTSKEEYKLKNTSVEISCKIDLETMNNIFNRDSKSWLTEEEPKTLYSQVQYGHKILQHQKETNITKLADLIRAELLGAK